METNVNFQSMAAIEEQNILMYSLLDYENKPAHVYLTSTQIIIENNNRPRSNDISLDARPSSCPSNQVIDLKEIIAVRADHKSPIKDRKVTSPNKPSLLQEEKSSGTNTFSIFVIKRVAKHRWRHKKCLFVCRDYGTCQIWIEKLQDILRSPEWKRPKRLLVFINPFGGKKKAVKIFNEKVRPLFELAGIYSEVIITKRQYHARDVIFDYDLHSVDGLVCVGGDGTFSELLNGLLDRVNAEAGVQQIFRHTPVSPSVRIGIIPAGSTDAIVYSLVGINDPVTSALQIILGDSIGMDVTALYKKEEFVKYTVTMSGYGYYGDLLKESETLRWMGPKRYTWSGFKTFLANKAYEGEVSFLLASEEDSHPRDHTVCYAGCEKCRKAGMRSELTSSSQIELDLGAASEGLSAHRRANFMLKDGWHHVKGRFSAINLVTISCRCSLSPQGMSPSSHLGDGCMDLILIQDCSRLDYLRHLARIPDSRSDQFDFDFIQVYRVKEFCFQPATEPEECFEDSGGCAMKKSGHTRMTSASNSCWNCDGEVFDHPSLYIQVHCQLIKLFGRGVEESNRHDSLQCPTCCSAYDSDK
ncbi:ceramide kinase-like [Physella acuta]|uniref:ceramide kinase-like n=1 Tax=Physella acuta TaxID=109671 RepID=UPI0027DE1268|nr:ceramide kinase-like [Physella acuta]